MAELTHHVIVVGGGLGDLFATLPNPGSVVVTLFESTNHPPRRA